MMRCVLVFVLLQVRSFLMHSVEAVRLTGTDFHQCMLPDQMSFRLLLSWQISLLEYGVFLLVFTLCTVSWQ